MVSKFCWTKTNQNVPMCSAVVQWNEAIRGFNYSKADENLLIEECGENRIAFRLWYQKVRFLYQIVMKKVWFLDCTAFMGNFES